VQGPGWDVEMSLLDIAPRLQLCGKSSINFMDRTKYGFDGPKKISSVHENVCRNMEM
jgi:hypothetical protein